MIRRGAAALAASLLLAACGGHAAMTADTAAPRAPAPTAASGHAGAGAAAGAPRAARAQAARPRIPSGDWSQFGYDAQRSGAGPADTGITAADLGALRRRTVHVDGVVDAPAIELHAVRVGARARDVIVVTTTYGRTIALDAGTGRRLWEFVPAAADRLQGSSQITTAGPAADPDRRYVYATSSDGLVHKLVLATGGQVRTAHWPVRATLDPTREKLASPPTVSGRSLLVVTDGYYGDHPTYQGHVLRIDRASGRIEAVFNTLCSNRPHLLVPGSCPASGAAIWGRAGAVVEPGRGRILVTTGNGPFNGATDWGDSVLELTPSLRLLHNWTPRNQAALDNADADLGSTVPALLPGTRLAVQGGKSGRLWLLDLDALDGTPGGAGRRLGGELQQLVNPGGTDQFSAASVWRHGGRDYVFVATGAGTGAYVLGADRRLHVAWSSASAGTSPVVAGGLLYVYDHQAGRLLIRVPTSGRVLRSLPAAPGHWESPIVVGGRIVLAEGGSTADHGASGTVDIYHLPGR